MSIAHPTLLETHVVREETVQEYKTLVSALISMSFVKMGLIRNPWEHRPLPNERRSCGTRRVEKRRAE